MEHIEDKSLNDLLSQVKIPPAPEILLALNQQMQNHEPDLQQIAGIIQKDASISGLVLKTVNSALFGLKHKIASIPHAISLLGLTNTLNIVRGLVLRQTLDHSESNLPHFWESPSNIAMIAANLAKRLLKCSSDEAYLLGLFHNAGHALINQRFDDYSVFLQEQLNHEDKPITHFEDQRYNLDHATLGFYLARSWSIPEPLQDVILHHHDSIQYLDEGSLTQEDDCKKGLLAILKMAEHIENSHIGVDVDHEWERVKVNVLGYMELSEVDFEDIVADMLEQLDMESH